MPLLCYSLRPKARRDEPSEVIVMTRRTEWPRLIGIGVALLFSICTASSAQEKDKAPDKKIAIRAGRLIDGKSDMPVLNALILIEGDKIVSVTPGGTPPAGVELID